MAYCALHQKHFSDMEDCPFCTQEEDDAICTCDFDEIENCPVHYPIDEESDPDDCMECGVCDACVEQTRQYFEEMKKEQS